MGQGSKGNPPVLRRTDTFNISGLTMEAIRRLLEDILSDDSIIERIEIEPSELRVTYFNAGYKKNQYNPSLRVQKLGRD